MYFGGALWRSIRDHGRQRPDVGAGCPERFEWAFLRDWVWTYPVRSRAEHRRLMSALPAGVLGIVLTSPRAVTAFERNLPGCLDTAAAG